MSAELPPLRLTGAHILRNGTFMERSLAIADGRITKGPLPAIDLTGYLVLPGIIDMMACPPANRRRLDMPETYIDEMDRLGAAHGVTTQYLCQGWSWEGLSSSPSAAERMAEDLNRVRQRSVTDLRMMLRIEHALAPESTRILETIRGHQVDLVMFSNRAARARRLLDTNPAKFAAQAHGLHLDPDTLRLTLQELEGAATLVPRALCLLAEQFDMLGVVYGSVEDETGEAREHHSMIGATLCMTPGDNRAAAAARAVSDPVILSAGDVKEQLHTRTLDRTQLLRSDALVSAGDSAALADVALRLDQTGALALERAWGLISEGPARMLRLTDQGRLDIGARADITIVNATTRKVEATISRGRLAFLTGEAGARFMGRRGARRAMAAE